MVVLIFILIINLLWGFKCFGESSGVGFGDNRSEKGVSGLQSVHISMDGVEMVSHTVPEDDGVFVAVASLPLKDKLFLLLFISFIAFGLYILIYRNLWPSYLLYRRRVLGQDEYSDYWHPGEKVTSTSTEPELRFFCDIDPSEYPEVCIHLSQILDETSPGTYCGGSLCFAGFCLNLGIDRPTDPDMLLLLAKCYLKYKTEGHAYWKEAQEIVDNTE
jgi:hypothetical protein